MRLFSIFLVATIVTAMSACQPERGCTDETADNFDINSEKDDGTCIPSRDKMIGEYTYTMTYTSAIDSVEYMDFGTAVISESNSGYNSFVLTLDGSVIMHGTSKRDEYSFTKMILEEDFQGLTFERVYYGDGDWLENDTVDTWFSLYTPWPIFVEGPPPAIDTLTQVYNYFCTKVED